MADCTDELFLVVALARLPCAVLHSNRERRWNFRNGIIVIQCQDGMAC